MILLQASPDGVDPLGVLGGQGEARLGLGDSETGGKDDERDVAE